MAHTNVTKLSKGQGFPMLLKAARPDSIAREACNKYFGEDKVTQITNCLHRSALNYEAIVEDLMKYERKHVRRMTGDACAIYEMVLQSVRQDLKKEDKIIPLTFDEVGKLPDFPGAKSPGLPHKLMNFRTKREVFEDEEQMAILKDMWYAVENKKVVHFPDVCLFARAQIAKVPKQKIRATWGYPFFVYMEEARFFYPLQDYIKSQKHNFPIAYGFEMANGGMSAINDMLLETKSSQYIVSDWQSFDKTIPPWLIRDAFAILAELIDFSSVGRESHNRRRWKAMVDYFVETPIRTCKGERFLVTGGVPSGSCFTNIIDSIINVIVTRFLVYQTTGKFPTGEIFLGDDGVFTLDGFANLEDWASLALQYFGMVLNVSKSYVTSRLDNVHFLGYFNINGQPFKNQDFLIASFIFPEHRRETKVDACAAALGQMYSGFDPLYAVRWLKIIRFIADSEGGHSNEDILLKLRHQAYRHKYLQQVGIDTATMTIPHDSGFVMEVLPKMSCVHRLRVRNYDPDELAALADLRLRS
uniref:RNA-dependent RNA polymerase n=1 Tax=Soybean thrips partiti-like virus 9 TaxID=2801011 RepID=A0A7T8E822_9VIRU|nr:RNA-dependent RNA polymerase [Soybean thrips partiti-like virus 9]